MVEPDNYKVLEIFLLVQHQWIFTQGQPIAIDLKSVYPLMDIMNLSNDEKLENIYKLQIIQQSYLKHLPKPKKNKK